MGYSSFITGVSILDDNINGLTAICLYSYNDHCFNESRIRNNLETITKLLQGVAYEGINHIQSTVWSAPWLEEGYKVSTHGVTYMYDMSICEIYMTPEKYMVLENPLEEFRKYTKYAMMENYHVDDASVIQPSENIKTLILELNQILHYMRTGQDSSSRWVPIWVPL